MFFTCSLGSLLTGWPPLHCRKFYVGGGNPDDFYTSASARQAFKNHMKTVVSRKNTITGVVSHACHLLACFYHCSFEGSLALSLNDHSSRLWLPVKVDH